MGQFYINNSYVLTAWVGDTDAKRVSQSTIKSNAPRSKVSDVEGWLIELLITHA